MSKELRCGDRTFALGARTYVMGVVNITPDSFSDGGHFADPADAYGQAMRLLEDGADVVDLGAESTRPGADPISADEEWRRLDPVLTRLVASGVRCISVDTSKATIAERALDRGAAWINDVSGLADPALARVAARADALIVMHQREMLAGAASDPVAYGDVVDDVAEHLRGLVARAAAAGVATEAILVDPGLGFGKTVTDNLALIDRADELRALGQPVIVGPSRKRFVAALSGARTIDERDAATVGACCLAAARGADMVRVHSVRAVRLALAVVDAGRSVHRTPVAP